MSQQQLASCPPLIAHDDQGWVVPDSYHPRFSPPVYVNVESRQRDRSKYPWPTSFELTLECPLRMVRSIEVIDFVCENEMVSGSTTTPQGNYFYLANGLVTGIVPTITGTLLDGSTGGQFTPQGVVGLYSDAVRDQFRPAVPQPLPIEPLRLRSENASYTTGAPFVYDTIVPLHAQDYNPIGKHAFCKFLYDSTKPVQIYDRQNARRTHYKLPHASTLHKLQFSLVERNGTIYGSNRVVPTLLPADAGLDVITPDDDIASDGEFSWSCTLMITTSA